MQTSRPTQQVGINRLILHMLDLSVKGQTNRSEREFNTYGKPESVLSLQNIL